MNPECSLRTALRGALLPPALLLSVSCGGGSGSGDASAAATGDPLTTYVSYRRVNTATAPPFSDLPELSSIQRGNKDFSREFDVVANIFDGSHGGIALDYFGTMYSADIDADFPISLPLKANPLLRKAYQYTVDPEFPEKDRWTQSQQKKGVRKVSVSSWLPRSSD